MNEIRNHFEDEFMTSLRKFFTTPMRNKRALLVGVIIAFTFIAIPDWVQPNDWELNTMDFWRGLDIYDSPKAIYPPWALILMQPYYLMTAAGARVVSVLVIILLAVRRDWTLATFFLLVLNPFMLFAASFSNIDLLVYTLPVLLWEIGGEQKRGGWLLRGLAAALMILKPQGAVLILPYLAWRERERWPSLVHAAAFAAVLTVPISFVGSPPLLVGWVENILGGSYGVYNNISLTSLVGFPLAVMIVLVAFGSLAFIIRDRWSYNHSVATMLLAAMLLSPYTSHQSIIAAMAFIPSWKSVGFIYAIALPASLLGLYDASAAGFWMLLFSLASLWLFKNEDL